MNPKAVSRGVTSSSLRWESHDTLSGFTATAVLGALAFIALGVFGLPQIDLHSPLHYAGIMDPLCGMTRAMRSLAIGDLGSAWRYNPGSFVVTAFGVLFMTRFGIGLATRRWLTLPLPSRRVGWFLAVIGIAVLWVNQQVNADLLMNLETLVS